MSTTFTDTGRRTREQRHNYQHSRARMVIENTFGRCKARWRILHRRIDVAAKHVTTVILACFTLNNIGEVHKETFDAEWLNVDDNVPNIRLSILTIGVIPEMGWAYARLSWT